MQNWTLEEISIGVVFLVTFFGALSKLLQPLKEYKETQLENERRLADIESHQKKDLARFEKYDEDIKQVLLSVNVLLSHSIDNNHTAQLKQRKEELDKYLIGR